MIKSTLAGRSAERRSHDLIGRNVAELVDLPPGQPGRPSRAMTEEQASKVLNDRERPSDRLRQGRKGKQRPLRRDPRGDRDGRAGVRHQAAHEGDDRHEVSTELKETTCRLCRARLGIDDDADANLRLEALFVLSITLGLRPGELRKLTWDHVDLANGVVHVWRSSQSSGDTKTPKSKRSLVLPKRAIDALTKHKKRQAAERLRRRRPPGTTPTSCSATRTATRTRTDALNWRFSKMTRRAGIGHWHAHEGRHTAVSIMSHNGVPIQDISDTVGHKSTHVTETVYRHVIVPAIRGGASGHGPHLHR